MLMNVGRLMTALLLFGLTTALAQEPEKKPESISTEPKVLMVEWKTAAGKVAKISGEAVFTPQEANSDDTMTGRLTYAISLESRREIARAMNQAWPEIPERVTVNDVVVTFVRKASCPDLEVEFITKEVEIAGGKADFDRLRLAFRETSSELSRLFCRWARNIETGRVNPICPCRAINRILKGEN